MDIIVVGGRQVIKCEHCQGTTLCRHSIAVRREDGGFVYRCSLCGDGTSHKVGAVFIKTDPGQVPVCRVCVGKGYTAL